MFKNGGGLPRLCVGMSVVLGGVSQAFETPLAADEEVRGGMN